MSLGRIMLAALVLAAIVAAALLALPPNSAPPPAARQDSGTPAAPVPVAATPEASAPAPAAPERAPTAPTLAAITGTVTDPGGAPIAGAQVRAAPFERDWRGRAWHEEHTARVETDARGTFRLEPLRAQVTVTAQQAGYCGHAPAVREQVAAGESDLHLVLELCGSVSGTVFEGDGRPLADARVRVDSIPEDHGKPRGERWQSLSWDGQTGADGSYHLDSLPTTALRLAADHDDWSHEVTTITLAPGEHRSGVDFHLQAGLEISGSVLDERSAPFAGATVTADGKIDSEQGETVLSRKAVVGADGSYALRGLDAGNYRVSAHAPGAFNPAEDYGREQLHPAGTTGLDFVLHRGCRVEGIVVDPDGQPVAGSQIDAWLFSGKEDRAEDLQVSSRGFVANARSDSEGHFALAAVAPGPVAVLAWGTAGYMGSLIFHAQCEAGGTLQGVELRLRAGLSLRGRVVDSSGTPVAGAKVEAMPGERTFGEGLETSATSCEDGSFEIRGLRAGQSFRVSASAGEARMAAPGALAGVPAGTEGLELVLESGAVLRGTVRGPDGAGLAARVGIERPRPGGSWREPAGMVETEADGHYELRGIPAGNYLAIAYDLRGVDRGRRMVRRPSTSHTMPG